MKLCNSLAAILCGITLTSTTRSDAGEVAPIATVDPEPHDHTTSYPDDHAPIGVMGEHTHGAGEFMLSYRYMYMSMEDNYDGSSKVSDSRVLRDYMVVPTSMDMEMHMLGMMYAPTDRVTLMLMAPYSFLSMDHLRRDGTRFTTESEGWGDLKLSSLISLVDTEDTRLILNLGVGLPTGSTDETDTIPGPGETQLPYPMQIGSGSWSIQPGLTYTAEADRLSWGAQVLGDIYLDDNDQGYRLGDSVDATAWLAYRLSDKLSTSLRVAGSAWGNIDGADRDLRIPAAAVPTADPNLRGGKRVDVGVGVNYLFGGRLSGHRLAVEALFPVHQDLDGPQLGADWSIIAGWQFAF